MSNIDSVLLSQAIISSTTQSATPSIVATLKSQVQISGLTSNSVSSASLIGKSYAVVSSTTEDTIAIFTVVVADPPSIVINSVTEDASGYLDVDWIFSVQVGSTTDNSTCTFTLDLFEPYIASNIYTVEKINRLFIKQEDNRQYSVTQESRLFSVPTFDRSFTVKEQNREFTV